MAESPQAILQKLVQTALEMCRADSAGISILESDGTSEMFRWPAIAGLLANHVGGGLPRSASPGGVVLDRNASLLFAYPERHFDYGMKIDPPIVEALFVPFQTGRKPVGMLWVVAHTPSRQFDAEDQRLLTSLSRFAAVAYQMRTALVTTDAGLKAKADEVRQILGAAAIGLTHSSRDLRYLACNRAYEKLVGLTADQIIGRPMIDVLGTKAFDVIRPYIDRVLRGERVEFDVEVPISAGEPRFFHVVDEPWFDSEGQVSGWIASVSDITDLKRATIESQEREQRLRLALDACGAGSWTRDFRTDRIERDDRFRKLYGFTAGEPISFEAWLSRVHEEDRRQVLQIWDQILHTKAQDTFDTTFRIVRPDGSMSWIQSLGHAQRDADGHVTGLTGFELDVTERRRAEELLQARRAEEREQALHRQAEEALRRSHAELERRTLQLRRLASQLTLAEQSARRQLASTLHDGLQQLLFSAGITLDEMMKPHSQNDQAELLARARADVKESMEAARTLSVNLFPPVLHLGGLPAALTWLARRTHEQYSVAVNVTADPRANPEESDVRILLFEAVRELLFNAVKHAHVDRVDVNLALGPGDAIYIQVSDEGVGFDPTTTLHHENQSELGLGLFSIQERLALHGGHLDIKSAPGKGSRFVLTLPRTGLRHLATDNAEVRHPDTAWLERLAYDSASVRSESLRILIADDHPVARTGLRELFSRRPTLQVVGEAANGVEAIVQAMTLQPDVIVMDVSMRQMNGIEATREIHATLPHIQIVGFSTHDDENTERLMRKAGAEAYFTKNEGTERLLDYLLSLTARVKPASTG
jgi:PAS domain S-box-containing protein